MPGLAYYLVRLLVFDDMPRVDVVCRLVLVPELQQHEYIATMNHLGKGSFTAKIEPISEYQHEIERFAAHPKREESLVAVYFYGFILLYRGYYDDADKFFLLAHQQDTRLCAEIHRLLVRQVIPARQYRPAFVNLYCQDFEFFCKEVLICRRLRSAHLGLPILTVFAISLQRFGIENHLAISIFAFGFLVNTVLAWRFPLPGSFLFVNLRGIWLQLHWLLQEMQRFALSWRLKEYFKL